MFGAEFWKYFCGLIVNHYISTTYGNELFWKNARVISTFEIRVYDDDITWWYERT